MAIPFVRCLPGGKRVLNEISRDPSVELKAAEFIDHAGRFLIEIVPAEGTVGEAPKTQVHLMAIIDKAEGCTKVAERFCPNGPGLLNEVDALVEEAYPHIPIRLFVPANKNLEIVK